MFFSKQQSSTDLHGVAHNSGKLNTIALNFVILLCCQTVTFSMKTRSMPVRLLECVPLQEDLSDLNLRESGHKGGSKPRMGGVGC